MRNESNGGAIAFWAVLALPAALLGGCLPWVGPETGARGSIGTVSHGLLLEPERLPREGEDYVFYKRTSRRWGIPELISLVRRTARRVGERHPGSRLMLGDLSAGRGGFVGGHRSHRSGRDVDIGFFTTNTAGTGGSSAPLVAFDRFGVGSRRGEPQRFDDARNWAVVEALLTDPEADVQWIFVSRGLEARLLSWALGRDRDPRIVERAASVLHQPSDSAPHDDHFHLRIYCPTPGPAACRDLGPVWPWVAKRRERRFSGETRWQREDLVRLGLEGIGG
jgi:penicillin-insensitive murein DD-endopeptidase